MNPSGPRGAGGPAVSSATDIPPDWIDLSELPANARRVAPIESAREAMEVAPPRLARPLLMVHGLAQHADTWANMKQFLCGDSHNRWGGVFHTAREAEFTREVSTRPDSKVFALDVSDNLAHPRVVANEVRRAIDAICKATGATQVDVMTHSMGSLVTREAIRQGETRIPSLCMIAPPNHGSYEASLASGLHDAGVYDHYPELKMGAMDALRLEYGPMGGVRNEWLHELNEFWAGDPNRPQAAVITGSGIATPDRSLRLGTATGDAMVAARRAPLDGADFFLAVPNKLPPGHESFRDFQDFRYNHLQVVSEPEIYRQVTEFLVKAGAQPPGVSPASVPPPAPRPGDLDAYLTQVQDRTREIRRDLVETDFQRAHYARWEKVGAVMTASGVGVGALGTLLGSAHPALGLGMLAVGVVAVGWGTVLSVRNAARLDAEVGKMSRVSEEALNMSDNVVHRVRQSQQPPPSP